MKIWIYLNGLQQGPYTLEQVKLLPIDATTPVWYEGLPQWTPAGQASATAPLFMTEQASNLQPPFEARQAASQPVTPPQGVVYVQAPPRPKTYIVWSVILTILCCSPFALAGIITGAISSSRYSSGDYSAAKSMSTVTEWLLIISIVWAIIGIPVGIAKSCISLI